MSDKDKPIDKAIEYYNSLDVDDPAWGESSGFYEGCRWQFEQSRAEIEAANAKLEKAEKLIRGYKAALELIEGRMINAGLAGPWLDDITKFLKEAE